MDDFGAIRVFRSPGWYVQGPGAISKLADYVRATSRRPLLIASDSGLARLSDTLGKVLPEALTRKVVNTCTFAQIEEIADALRVEVCDGVIGLGGGSILDTARAAAHRCGLPVFLVPTVASTDAPTASAAVIYSDTGRVAAIETFPVGPVAVVVDTDLIRSAPRRMLVSGFGDALATAYEAEATLRGGGHAVAGGLPTRAAMAIARECRQALFEHGGTVARGDWPPSSGGEAFESVVEANILLSGLGFESGGLAAAHAFHNGLREVVAESVLHGEAVGYGLLVQLALEGHDDLDRVHAFLADTGLPRSLTAFGLSLNQTDAINRVIARALDPNDSMRNMQFEVTTADLRNAVVRVEELAKTIKTVSSRGPLLRDPRPAGTDQP